MPVATKPQPQSDPDEKDNNISPETLKAAIEPASDEKKMYRLLAGKHLSADGDVYYGISVNNPQGDLIELTDKQAEDFGDRVKLV